MKVLVATVLLALAPVGAVAQELPQSLAPSDNFPHILAQAPYFENVAPGVEYGEYSLVTVDGPMVVRVIAAQLRRSDVHVSTILAHDTLTSSGETVGSMGKRNRRGRRNQRRLLRRWEHEPPDEHRRAQRPAVAYAAKTIRARGQPRRERGAR